MKKQFSSYWIRSAFYSILQRFSVTLFGLLNYILLVHMLPKAQVGTWTLFLAVTTIFELTKTGLLKNAHVKYVSMDMEVKVEIASSSLLINGAISGLFILLILVAGPWGSVQLHSGRELYSMLCWFIPGVVLMMYFAHLEAVQQSHLDFKGVFAGYLVRQGAFFVYLALAKVLHHTYSLNELVLAYDGSILLGTFVLYLYTRRYLSMIFNPSRDWVMKILQYGKYIFASGVVSNIYSSLDQMMTGALLADSGFVADYGAANRINTVLDVPSYAAADVLFPKSSRASVEEGPEKVRYLFERMVGILFSFSVPIAIISILLPKLILFFIAGPAYYTAAPILQLYMITGSVRPMQNQAANLLNSIGKQATCLWMNTIGLAVNLVVSYECFLHFGFYGFAIGSTFTYSLIIIAWYFLMKKIIGVRISYMFKYMWETYRMVFAQGRQMLGK